MASWSKALRGQRPQACTETHSTETGRSHGRLRKRQTVSESLRTYTDDERSWEVGSIHSTGEAAEQSGQPRGGGGRGKGSSQGEPAQARQALDTEPGELAHWAGAGTASSRTGQETTIHRAPAPYLRHRPFASGVLGNSEGRRSRHQRGDVAALRRETGRKSPGSCRTAGARSVPGKTGTTGYIEKADGRKRPLGVPVLEDKIVQRSVVEVLNAIYEVDFVGFSYGFRPGRSPHQALDALAFGIWKKWVNWILDSDLQAFFDTLRHDWLVKFLEYRIADLRVIRLIQKWLHAGVLEDGKRMLSEIGTVQGGSISPLLANVYLRHAFDLWAQQWRKKQAHGDVLIVRCA